MIRLLLIFLCLAAAPVHAEDAQVKTPREKASYALGVNLMGNLKQQGVDFDLELVQKGMRDAASGNALLLEDEELRKYVSMYYNQVRNKQAGSRPQSAQKNKKAGAAYLAQNSRKEGVVTRPSGMQYQVLKEGEGKKPAPSDSVEFHYRTTSITGTEYDSSYLLEKPTQAKVSGGVVPGLSEALQLMPVGSKWRLFLPPQLAYGARGYGNKVGPEETVVLEVELLAIR
ncbi:FKBP-type peptidyl-prolyl cis-trans isomerase [Geomonas sp. RF6]|uniref:FKBP-type peptidyl-prolyl cis-trans isomerase N-terminal domain-containing protein n=1 Tax=Geomonas sp. RF6 TaxID=2897342 RepID=UPI001E386969|nr:FKBP-type peptidyl-prolyl cis-trans isomerase [Geomonas sp. RF6]UFS70221.1 FKBP-type peptidyl-prolyl cis-trans isomerase [Geomonas sp. RF6]